MERSNNWIFTFKYWISCAPENIGGDIQPLYLKFNNRNNLRLNYLEIDLENAAFISPTFEKSRNRKTKTQRSECRLIHPKKAIPLWVNQKRFWRERAAYMRQPRTLEQRECDRHRTAKSNTLRRQVDQSTSWQPFQPPVKIYKALASLDNQPTRMFASRSVAQSGFLFSTTNTTKSVGTRPCPTLYDRSGLYRFLIQLLSVSLSKNKMLVVNDFWIR